MKRGFGLVEIVIGASIIGSVIFAATFSIINVGKLATRTTETIRANYLLLEAVDVAKILRDSGWTANISTLTLGTPYYVVWDSGAWTLTPTQSVIDGIFYRTLTFYSVSRNINDNIVTSGGTLDTGTLRIVADTSWLTDSGTTTKTFETYITDLYNN